QGRTVTGQIPQETTVAYKGSDGTILQTVSKTWHDLFVVQSEQITLGTNGPTSHVTYTYGPGDQVTEKDEYDFGQTTPSRKTVTTYQSFASTPTYPLAPSIFDRPSTVIIYDGGGNRFAETDYAYDQTAIAPTAATGHDETNYGPSSSA